jgi:hypothetical protein
LTDAPAAYEEVNVTFSEVEINRNGGWVSIILDTAMTVDLLDWNNGKSIEIGRSELEPGKVTQIRLTIDRAEVQVDGQTYPLEIPGSEESGLKLNTNFDIVAGVVYELVLDFDVNRSVNKTGNDEYKMNPVIRTVPQATTGAISGNITSPDNYTVVTATDGQGMVVTTTVADAGTGYFMLSYLEAGGYTVECENQSGQTFTKNGVVVEIGKVTDIGPVTLQ